MGEWSGIGRVICVWLGWFEWCKEMGYMRICGWDVLERGSNKGKVLSK